MARKLRLDEAEVFADSDTARIQNDNELFLRTLAEKENEPLDLTIAPELWLSGFTPGSSGR